MITKAKPAELSTRDLIDRIAKALPRKSVLIITGR